MTDDEDRAKQIFEAGDPKGVVEPYEDGYCRWCGNGYWKHHMPICAWADAVTLQTVVDYSHRQLLSGPFAASARHHLQEAGMTSTELRDLKVGFVREVILDGIPITSCVVQPVIVEGVIIGLKLFTSEPEG